MTHTQEALKGFFTAYMPGMLRIIEDTWVNSREDLILFLEESINSGVLPTWTLSYFNDMLDRAKTTPHEYTDPWKIL